MELHSITDKKALERVLKEKKVDVNCFNDIGDAPLHTLVRRAVSDNNKKWYKLLWSFLVHCDRRRFDVNIRNTEEGKTALHLATEKNALDVVKALIVFGADVNCLSNSEWSPMDHAVLNNNQAMLDFLQTRNALAGKKLRELKLKDLPVPDAMPVSLIEGSFPKLDLAQSEVSVRTHTGETPLEAGVEDGQRILCLDGGGCKGLIIIEVLMYIEKLTQRRIVDLFDWIVGTSAGAIIALALVYQKKTLQELKQLFFEMADSVFGTVNSFGYGCDSEGFSTILKGYFGEDMKMTAVTEPKVLISAVDCSHTDLKLVFFNNCLYNGDAKYRDALVWKVARYTSSGPVYFEPEDNYIDGGLKANNPTEFGLTVIQKEMDAQQELLKDAEAPKYACVVSVGCGKFRPEKLGDFSIQKYMSLGRHTFHLYDFIPELKNLLRLLGTACSLEEEVAESSRLRCEKQNIPFYRFSPPFPEVKIHGAETDQDKMCELIFRAQACLTSAWSMPIHRLRDLLLRVEKNRIHKDGFKTWTKV